MRTFVLIFILLLLPLSAFSEAGGAGQAIDPYCGQPKNGLWSNLKLIDCGYRYCRSLEERTACVDRKWDGYRSAAAKAKDLKEKAFKALGKGKEKAVAYIASTKYGSIAIEKKNQVVAYIEYLEAIKKANETREKEAAEQIVDAEEKERLKARGFIVLKPEEVLDQEILAKLSEEDKQRLAMTLIADMRSNGVEVEGYPAIKDEPSIDDFNLDITTDSIYAGLASAQPRCNDSDITPQTVGVITIPYR